MLFDQVTAQHIQQGIKDFEEKGFPNGFGPSSTYDIRFEGKLYPPKAIMLTPTIMLLVELLRTISREDRRRIVLKR